MTDYPKVNIGTRFLAAVIDALLSWVVGFIPIIGAIVGTVYMLIKDGLFEGQSLGKKVMKLQVVTASGEKADYSVSVKRNLIFAIPLALMIIPILGWIIAPILSIIILIVEVVVVLQDPNGRRVGDKFANSQVIEMLEESQATTIKED